MKYRETTICEEELLEVTAHGHYYVNPYFGCSEGCPHCYWTNLPGWEGQITIRRNIVEVFARRMRTWDKGKRICIGSYCNPYEAIESRWRLTRGLLEVCREEGVPFLLSTSSEVILEDLELIAGMKEQAVVVMELARIPRLLDFARTGVHPAIDAANVLRRRGVTVLATASPYLAGITDVDRLLGALDGDIPLYLGPLDLDTNWTTAARLLPQIYEHKPELLDHYGWVIREGHAREEFEAVLRRYAGEPRVKTFPLEVEYGA